MSILQRLHDSEINCGVSCFFDGCWHAFIGDDMNGIDAETRSLTSFAECEAWLDAEAKSLYPNSLFATGRRPSGYKVGPCGAPLGVVMDGASNYAKDEVVF